MSIAVSKRRETHLDLQSFPDLRGEFHSVVETVDRQTGGDSSKGIFLENQRYEG